MDATRSDPDYLAAGAAGGHRRGRHARSTSRTRWAMPYPSSSAISSGSSSRRRRASRTWSVSVHCHNDLGLAVANSLAAIENGATQVECADQRPGRAGRQRVAGGDRHDPGDAQAFAGTGRPASRPRRSSRTSRLVSQLTGYDVQPNKAIVGKNAFAHESGIHQDGVLKERTTYEIMSAESVGRGRERPGAGQALGPSRAEGGHGGAGHTTLSEEELNQAFVQFKKVADKKKQITAVDLEALVGEEVRGQSDIYELKSYEVTSSSEFVPTCQVDHREGRRASCRARAFPAARWSRSSRRSMTPSAPRAS